MLRLEIKVLCFAVTLLFTASAMATTGNELKQLADDGERVRFADGVFIGFVMGVAETGWSPAPCVPTNATNGQYVEVVRKYLKDHPEELHLPATILIQKAFNKAWPCK
jgi:hypothetical protein